MAKLVAETQRDQYAALIALVVLAAALIWAQAVIIPVVIAILLMFILTPLVMYLQRKGLRRAPAVLLVMLATLAGVLTLLFLIANQLHGLAQELPAQKDNITNKIRELVGSGPGAIDNLIAMVDAINADLNRDAATGAPAPKEAAEPRLTSGDVLRYVAGVLGSLLGTIGLVLILATSMLFTREDLRNRVIRLAGYSHLTRTTRALEEASRRISAYLIVQVMLNAAFGTALGVGLFAMGVPYAFLWGVMAAVLRFVPFIGTWLAGAFPLVVSLALPGWGKPVGVILLVIALGFVINSVIEPMLVSRRTGVSAIALVVSVTFWTWLWGPIGLILATPMTVCLAVLGKHVPGLHFLDVLLGTEPVLETHLGYYQRLLARDDGEAADLVEKYLEDHSQAELFDGVMVPTLIRARDDLERGHVRPEDVDFIEKATKEILDDTPEPAVEEPAQSAGVEPVLYLGVATHGTHEDLGLVMLDRALRKAHGRMEMVGSGAVTAEVVERAEEKQPLLACVLAMPPGGVARAKFVCKRLRTRFPDLPIVVGYWGGENDEEVVETLKRAGATHVTRNLKETAEQVAPLLQVQAAQRPVSA